MYTPPDSPFKSSFEFKSPRYAPRHDPKDEPQVHPFDKLPTPPLDAHLVNPISKKSTNKRPISRVPLPVVRARTFPLDGPTATSPAQGTSDLGSYQDPNVARTFHLEFPFIYSKSLPLYQIDTSSPTGELRIRKLHPRDTRAHSVPEIHHDHPNALYFPNQDALFTISNSLLHSHSPHITSPVCISTGSTLWHKPLCKIWQGEPGSKHLLWSVCTGKGVWEDSQGIECAREVKGGLEVNGNGDVMNVDLLVGCWIMRIWEEGDVRRFEE